MCIRDRRTHSYMTIGHCVNQRHIAFRTKLRRTFIRIYEILTLVHLSSFVEPYYLFTDFCVFSKFDTYCIGTVSYTHLDVYKRQMQKSGWFCLNLRLLSFAIEKNYTCLKKTVAGKLPLSHNRSSPKIIGLESVSYTHLDVYKRQDL